MSGFKTLLQLMPWSLLFLTACSFMPEQPDYAAKVENDRSGVTAWSQLEPTQETTSLNQLIDSKELNALLAEAMDANPGLQQTLLTLQIRRAQLRQTRADQLPAVEANYTAGNEEGYNNSYTGLLAISWEVDLWQKLAYSSRATAKDVEEQAALLQAARDSLGADLMKNWLGLIAQRNAITIEQRRLNTLQQNERFILQRYRNGLGTLEDLDSARSSVASTKATIVDYSEILAQQQRALNTLLGRTQQTSYKAESTYPAVIVPLADLPAQTLQRRPDLKAVRTAVRQAEAALLSAREDLSRTRIVAPFDALVVQRQVSPGSYVQAGSEIAMLYSSDYVEINVDLSARDWQNLPNLNALDTGHWPVELIGVESAQRWTGRVLRAEQHLDENTRQRALVVAVDQPLDQTPALYPGTFLKVRVNGLTRNNLWKLPSSALSQRSEIWYVTEDHTLASFSAEAVFSDSQWIYIDVPEGLAGGVQHVVIHPLSSYLQGMRVNPIEPVNRDG